MTQKERDLLLKDLCARLPYKPKIQWDCADYDLLALENCEPILARIMDDRPYSYAISKPLEESKPYLRPMSSMTEEEKKELSERYVWKINGNRIEIKYHSDGYWDDDIHCPTEEYLRLLDWLNAHHFDYRGLIPMGLALEAREGMYK